MLFLYTNSHDLSADVIIRRLGNAAVFRFNIDLWRDYQIEFCPDYFAIQNPAGSKVETKDIAKFLWRKPYTNQELYPDRAFPQEQVYEEEEIAYAMREAWNAMYLSGRAVLIDPLSDAVAGKLIQAQIARKYFTLPDWTFVSGVATGRLAGPQVVAKSFTSLRTDDRSMLFTTRVDPNLLSIASPWFLQSLVPAEQDVTVVFIRGSAFAFSLCRRDFPGGVVDWRRARYMMSAQEWLPHVLPDNMAAKVREFMSDMSLHYGRLDFLFDRGTYYFLEVNPNGEWGWLDASGESGIIDALIRELSPDTPCHPLPNPRVIRVE